MSGAEKLTETAGDPDCSGLTVSEIEARFVDHTLPRPTLKQLIAYRGEMQRRQDAAKTGFVFVKRPVRTGQDVSSDTLADPARASDP